ncbi:hypothetical protein JFT70_00375 [Bacillus sp. TH11]|nr:hypothetical protein [Bacillus sp. TH11]
MPTPLQEQVEEARETYVSRIILVGGSALFLTGGVISAISAFKKVITVWQIRHLLQMIHNCIIHSFK